MGGYLQNLESRNWVSQGNVSFSLDGLPPQTRVRSMQIIFDLQGTKNAADTLNGDQFYKVLSNLKIGTYVNIGGPELAKLCWMADGHVVEDPLAYYSVTNTSATTFNLYCVFNVYFRETRSSASDDGSIPSELLSSRQIELTTASGGVWNVGALTVNSGVIRVCIERIHETNIPALTRIGYYDASSQTIRLEAGLYKDLMITKQDGSTLSNADVNSVDLIADGRPILQNVRFEQLINQFNRSGVKNPSPASGGTGLAARSELVKTAAAFLPLVWMDNSGKSNLTKQMLVEKDLLLQLNGGTLTNARISYTKLVAKDSAAIAQIAQTVGAPPDSTTYEPATASKTPPHGVGDGNPPKKKTNAQYAYLPGKFRRTPTPGNKIVGK